MQKTLNEVRVAVYPNITNRRAVAATGELDLEAFLNAVLSLEFTNYWVIMAWIMELSYNNNDDKCEKEKHLLKLKYFVLLIKINKTF